MIRVAIEDVLRLDVSVHDANRVKGSQRAGDLYKLWEYGQLARPTQRR